MKPIQVLAIFANPKGSNSLRISEEDRVIHECVKRSLNRGNIKLEVCHAATIHDVRRALLENEYRIIHFSGHGTGKGLVFENEMGDIYQPPIDAFAELLSDYSPPIETVILNACYSENQGRLISFGVPYTIGMNSPISDRGAIEFSRGFYDALGAGKDMVFAFKEGCRTIKLSGLPDSLTPMLLKKISSDEILDNEAPISHEVKSVEIVAKPPSEQIQKPNNERVLNNDDLDRMWHDLKEASDKINTTTWDLYYENAPITLKGIVGNLDPKEIRIKVRSELRIYNIRAIMREHLNYHYYSTLKQGSEIKISGRIAEVSWPLPWKYVITIDNSQLIE